MFSVNYARKLSSTKPQLALKKDIFFTYTLSPSQNENKIIEDLPHLWQKVELGFY